MENEKFEKLLHARLLEIDEEYCLMRREEQEKFRRMFAKSLIGQGMLIKFLLREIFDAVYISFLEVKQELKNKLRRR